MTMPVGDFRTSTATRFEGFARLLMASAMVLGVGVVAAGCGGKNRSSTAAGTADARRFVKPPKGGVRPPNAFTIEILSGNDQTGTVGTALAKPFVIKLYNSKGEALPATGVLFQVAAGGGTLDATEVVSDDAGVAQATLTLGPTAGTNMVTATSGRATVTLMASGVTAPADTLTAVTGQEQTGVAGAPLAQPLTVMVTDANKQPKAGANVTFAVKTGGGTLSATTVATDATGRAATLYTLGTTAGVNEVTATLAGATGSPLSFKSLGTAGAAAALAISDGDNQTGVTGTPLAKPLTVLVSDANKNPVPNVSVAFAVASGGGKLSAATATTDAKGLASTSLTLGAVGANTVTATVQGLTPVTFTAMATAAPASKLAISSGDMQTGVAGAPLAQPLVVLVTDANNNPVPGFMVQFATTGGGALSAATAATDAKGLASTMLTLGKTAGPNTVTASGQGLTAVTFQSLGTAGAPAVLAIVSGDKQSGEISKPLAQPFVVGVTDANLNPVQNVDVAFAVQTGGGTLSATAVKTDAKGQAASTLTLGPTVTSNTVTATVQGLPAVTFTASGVAAPPTAIALTSGDAQTGVAGSPLAQPFVVTVTDTNKQPVAGFMVAFAVATGKGTLSASTVATDAKGQAATILTLDKTAGPNSVTATAAGLTGSPVTFSATGIAGPAATMAIASGDKQTAQINMALANPLVVKITDANGNAVAGTTVNWTVTAGGGTLSASTSTSGADGLASVKYAVGNTATANTVTATSTGLSGSPATFTATATAAAATQIAAQAGNNQTGVAGAPLANPFVVVVRDANNNPVAGYAVTFAVIQGKGTLSATSVMTNTMGFAMSTLTLDTVAGPNMVTASGTGLTGSPVTFTAAGQAGPAAKLTIASGDKQSGVVNTALAQPLVVKVSDKNDNAVAGTSVTFAVTAGGGTLSATTATSGDDGLASTKLTLGPTVTANTVQASATGLTAVTFTASAMAAPPTAIALTSGNNQTGVAGAPLAQPFVVTVTDANNQPVAGFTVAFTVATGKGTLSAASAATDAKGQASTILTLDAAAGPNSVTANATGLAGSPITFSATGQAGPAAKIVLTSGDKQSGVAGSKLAQPFVVTVSDANDNPVAGHTVDWKVTAGGGSLSAATSTTDAKGQASSTLTLGPTATTNTVTASSTGLTAVTFTATAMAAPPAAVAIVSGDKQSGKIGTELANPLVVKVTDANNNPLSGITVAFAAATGGGSVTPATAMTDAQGQASTKLTLGTTLGANTVTATVSGITPATFSAMASPLTWTDDIQPLLTARICTVCHLPGGQAGFAPLQTYAQLRFGTSLVGMNPYVTPFDGAKSYVLEKIGTGATGTMRAYLGATAAEQDANYKIFESWINTGAVEGTAQTATTVTKTSGDQQMGQPNTALGQPFVITVTDAKNLPVANTEVQWTVTAGGGSLAIQNGGATDLLGQSLATLTLGPTAGTTNTVTAMVPGVGTVTFSATSQATTATSVLANSTNPLDVAAYSVIQTAGVQTADLSSDDEFLRRVTGDLLGRLPSEAELAAFEADASATKRAATIDALLASSEFVSQWTNVIGTWVEVNPTQSETVNNVTVTYNFDTELGQDISNDVSLAQIVRKMITSTGDVGNGFRDAHGGSNLTQGTEVLATAFLGMSVRCGRCHDHKLTGPLDDPRWTQAQAYGLFAYMSNSSRYGNPFYVADGVGNRTDGPAYTSTNLDQRRTALADVMTTSPAFYRGTAHRIWSEIGAPLLNPNEFLASNLGNVKSPALLDALRDTFAAQNTSLKGFLRVALNSKLYQLSSAGTSTAADAYQGRFVLRRNYGEVIERGIHQIADVTYRSDSVFRATFNFPTRGAITSRDGNPATSDQALLLLNSSRGRAITDSGNQIASLANDVNNNVITYHQAVTTLVRAALSRDPTPAELTAIDAERDAGNTRASLEDVAVGVAASSEFVFRR